MELGESGKFGRRGSEGIEFVGRLPLVFSREVESVRGHQLRDSFGYLTRAQNMIEAFGALWDHATREDIHNSVAQFLILSGSGQKLFAGLLIQADRVKLVLGDVPPSGYDGVGQKAWDEISPDQGLHILRSDEILLGGGQHIGQIGELLGRTWGFNYFGEVGAHL